MSGAPHPVASGGHRALRFNPSGDGSASGGGFQVTVQGGLETVGGDSAVRQAIMLLLATVPGERVMRPDYGCHLDRLLFQPNDATTHGLAIHYVRTALEQGEPRVRVLNVDAEVARELAAVMVLRVVYEIRRTGMRDELVVSLDLAEPAS